MREKERQKYFERYLGPVLAEYGFLKKGSEFKAERTFGSDTFHFGFMKASVGYSVFAYHFSRRYERVETLLEPYLDELNIQSHLKYSTLAFNKTILDPKLWDQTSGNIAGYSFALSESGIISCVSKLSADFNTIIFPFMQSTESFQAMDQLANDPPEKFRELWASFTHGGLIFRKMIIAKLAASAAFEDVCQAVKQIIESWQPIEPETAKKSMIVYEKIYSTLSRL
jgi:hypothetical protein